MTSTTKIKSRNLNTDTGGNRRRNPTLRLAGQRLRLAGLLLGALVVTMTLSACEPNDTSAADNPEPAPATRDTSGAYSSRMGDNNIKGKTQRPEDFTECTDPRPEMCTQQYQPACGYFYDGEGEDGKTFRTFGNHCTACQHATVKGYVPGECPD